MALKIPFLFVDNIELVAVKELIDNHLVFEYCFGEKLQVEQFKIFNYQQQY